VRKADGVTQRLVEAQIVGDSLIGYTDYAWRPERTRVAVSLGDIRSTEVQRVNRARTTLLILGVGAAVAVVTLAVALGDLMSGFGDPYP